MVGEIDMRGNIYYYKSIFLLILGMLSSAEGLLAQQSKPSLNLENIDFLPVEGDLSEGTVTSIVQDFKGVLWFGTRFGLNRYNGIDFTVYEHKYDDSASISNSYINCLLEDRNHTLWVGTSNGLNVYNREDDTFKRFKADMGDDGSLTNNRIHTIFEDSKGNIWIGTEKGLNQFNPLKQTFAQFVNDPENEYSLSHNNIRTIFEDSRGNIWVGTYGGGLNKFNPEDNTFAAFTHNSTDLEGISSNHVKVSYKDRDGDIWIGTKGGLNRLIEKNGIYSFKSFRHEIENNNSIPHDIISALAEDEYGNLWIGTENGGLAIYNKSDEKFIKHAHDPLNPNSILHNSVWAIYRDNVGTMWLGVLNKGINKWDKYQSKFKHYKANASNKALSNSNVACFLEDDDGNLWIGTDGGGLNFLNRETNEYTYYLHDPFNENSIGSNAVIAMAEDRDDNLWIGTWEGGLTRLDKKTGKFTRFRHNPSDDSSISSNNIFSLLEDKEGRLWIAAFEGGLDLFNKETQTFKHYLHNPFDTLSLCHNKVFNLFEDSKGNIWIGTEGAGLTVMKVDKDAKASYSYYSHNPQDPSSIGGDVIVHIMEDSKNNVWIGTFGGGLSRFLPEQNKFRTYREEDGLPNNVVHGILEDDKGDLWISTNNGISRFNKQKNEFRNYSTVDGLQAQEFTRGSALKTQEGEFLFGGVNGFNSFFPDKISDNPHVPPVYITDFMIYGKQVKPGEENSPLKSHISDTKEIVLNHDQNVFSFEVSALNYTQAEENQYAYKLVGFDEDWQYIGNRRNIYYTKVPQGSYILKVKGSNNDGKWNEAGISVGIVVLPPWYATWWAYLLYGVVIVVLFILYRNNLIYKERLKSDLKLEHMELAKMQEVDQLKTNFFANISHEFRTPLTLILGPLKAMHAGRFEGDLKSQLKMMIRNGERLLRLINQLLDLTKLEEGKMKLKVSEHDFVSFAHQVFESFELMAKNNNIKLAFKASESEIKVFFDADKMEKILFNLLTNAIKFTRRDGEVNVSLSSVNLVGKKQPSAGTKEHLLIKISDNGIGISHTELQSIFNRFYQAGTSSTGEMKGTGIGLSLTKELVELHRGTIDVSSEPNRGTEFRIYLPVGSEHLSPDEIVCKPAEVSLSDRDIYDFDGLLEPSDEKMNLNVKAKAHFNLPTILVIEDNEDLRKYICDQLKDNYQLLQAKDGLEGLELATNKLPQLIISDVMMPGIDGFGLCKQLKTDAKTGHIPVILLTAKISSENQKEALTNGADYYMTKPFDAENLRLRVKNIFSSRVKLKDNIESNNILLQPKKVKLASSEEKFLKSAIQCIEDNMSNPDFGVEAFGEAMGISRMQLYRKLKSLTGCSANEFIKSMRLKRASQLLETGELNISEVTYEVGFNDLKYFRSCFKKEFGVNPSQFSPRSSIR